MTVSVAALMAPYEGGTRYPGPARGAERLAHLWRGDLTRIDARLGRQIPLLTEAFVARCLEEGRAPVVLGGDHSLTYHALRAVTSFLGPIVVAHFDAHHDAYAGPLLNHYTVMAVAQRDLPVQWLRFGHRFDAASAVPRRDAEDGWRLPVWVSIDADYFEPSLLPSVGHAVPGDPDAPYDVERFQRELASLEGPIVGADIVEWHGPASSSEEHVITRILHALLASLA